MPGGRKSRSAVSSVVFPTLLAPATTARDRRRASAAQRLAAVQESIVSSRNRWAIPRGTGVCQPGPHQANGSSYRGSGLINGSYTQPETRPGRGLVSLDLRDVWEIPELMPAGQTIAGEGNVRYGEPATHRR